MGKTTGDYALYGAFVKYHDEFVVVVNMFSLKETRIFFKIQGDTKCFSTPVLMLDGLAVVLVLDYIEAKF